MLEINPMLPGHGAAVLRIYGEGLATGQATFNTEVPLWEEWDRNHLLHSRFVAEKEGMVVGWVALSPVSGRACYRGVAEFSIYISDRHRGCGIGNVLMQQMIRESEAQGIWTLQSAVFPENKASIALQQKWGFREIGYREKVAQLHGVWRNTLLLERRSTLAGV